MLLNAQSFPFVIDLACLASRREYLKLEKWLTDKIREHGEPFITACIKFLQVTMKLCCVNMNYIMIETVHNFPCHTSVMQVALVLSCLFYFKRHSFLLPGYDTTFRTAYSTCMGRNMAQMTDDRMFLNVDVHCQVMVSGLETLLVL
jgi:hypothetical protein